MYLLPYNPFRSFCVVVEGAHNASRFHAYNCVVSRSVFIRYLLFFCRDYVNIMAAERLVISRLFVTSVVEGRTELDEVNLMKIIRTICVYFTNMATVCVGRNS